MLEEKKPFHIIVAGGGLVGLNAAHIFQTLRTALAGSRDIQFTILESHSTITPYIGSLLALWPSTFRVYDQLGLTSALKPVLDETVTTVNFRADTGKIINRLTELGPLMERRHGHGFRVCHRPKFAETLYETLSEETKGRVLLNKRVVDVETEADGVKVICEDGTVVAGDILIGADGVRSRVRTCMQRLKAKAQSANAGGESGSSEEDGANAAPEKGAASDDKEKSPYLGTFRMLFGNVPGGAIPDLPMGTNHEGASNGLSTQILTGTTQSWWAVYEQIPTPTHERKRYTEEDKQAFIEKYGDAYMAPGITLKQVLEYNSGDIGMISLEEGSVPSWTCGRVVLVGDAVRKVEPHAGAGFNSGLADIVTLANKLYALLNKKEEEDSSAAGPTTAELERAFQDYERERLQLMPTVDKMCRRRARQVTWTSWKYRIYATWIVKHKPIVKLGIKYVLAPIFRDAPVLAWLPEHNLPKHEVKYKYHGSQGTQAAVPAIAEVEA
ncbi:hypothetical protein PFICI_05567 [Pestalotiopsis fici W106-1]|uniref:FAD-binding domain-containing protein n=1 Tax=Pestalotiopsis fici (strain W106-1 / CGMCC3.15140) TaxID=1229662 RepID=W3XES6_PESFW|nr:uncharacterized protein PFICI_05567 [Pestalotiopsis fici W106-1]ETS83691.1 hypothetical protein PFICI_05567 [Pestalotiopsis fici W106-1]